MKLAHLREKVRTRCGIATGDQYLTQQNIDDAINEALAQIDGEYHWPWLEATAVTTLVSGQDTYPLPADFRATRSVVLGSSNGSNVVLYNISPTQALAKSTSETGQPEAFAIIGSNLVLLPTPGAGYSIKHLYYRQTVELVADADEPLIPDQWHGAVVAAAASNLAMTDDRRAMKEQSDADVANWIRRMRNALRRSTGPVVPRIRQNGWM
jgi:hypothetical protein